MVQKEKKYITWEGLNQHAKNTGKKIKEYDAGVIGGYNGSFPLTAATKGNIYLLPATKKYYVCIENYNGSQLTAPNANFEELSVYTNRSKLDNLITFTKDNNKNCLKYSNGLMIQYGQITDYTPEMGSILTIPFLEPFKSTAFWAASALNAAKAYPSRILEYKSIEISFNGGSSYISWLVFGTWK